jgi:hypothetical protein
VVGPTYTDYLAAEQGSSAASTDSSSSSGRRCCFFSSEEDMEEALSVLSSTTWDAADKSALLSARGQVTQKMGFEVVTAEASATSAEEAPSAGPDELDSYEALVRDAGKWRPSRLSAYVVRVLCWQPFLDPLCCCLTTLPTLSALSTLSYYPSASQVTSAARLSPLTYL